MITTALLATALVWHPATNWVDKVDPVVDVHARKGGTVRFNGAQPPKSFNAYIDNNTYTKMMFDLMYENLIGVDTETLDFVPGLARRWAVSEDGNEFVFELDERAHWSDGEPVTADDVKWTFDAVMDPKSDTGVWKGILGAFKSPVVEGPRRIRFEKKNATAKDWRDLLNCGTFYILPRHAFEGRDFNALDFLNAPVGGAYRITRVAEQVETEYSRVDTWWKRDFPSCRNVCNFDHLVVHYYISNENAFDALKKGLIDVYPCYTARIMAEETKGEKFERNWILKRSVQNHNPIGFHGFAMNMRRKPFDDLRVRKAMSMLVDREMMNATMMSNAYFLMNSFFTDLYDAGHPCTNETYRFDVEGAKRLLAEAGYGDGFEFTFLSRSASEDKYLAVFNYALECCNIKMHIRRKDFAAWMRDMDSFNFEMTWASYGQSLFRTPEIMWRSSEADRKGSNNAVGFKSEAVDRLLDAEKLMETEGEREEAYRQIDALLTAQCPYAFLWQANTTRLLYWNKFGMPKSVLGKYNDEDCIMYYWWYDDDKAAELESAVRDHTNLPNVPFRVSFDEVMAGSSADGRR